MRYQIFTQFISEIHLYQFWVMLSYAVMRCLTVCYMEHLERKQKQ